MQKKLFTVWFFLVFALLYWGVAALMRGGLETIFEVKTIVMTLVMTVVMTVAVRYTLAKKDFFKPLGPEKAAFPKRNNRV